LIKIEKGTGEQIKKMYLYSTQFYSATKNEILSFIGKWMELENIIISEVRQGQRPKAACSLSFVEYIPTQCCSIMKHWCNGEITQERDREAKNLNRVDIPTIQE
jgi:hypothetical protein